MRRNPAKEWDPKDDGTTGGPPETKAERRAQPDDLSLYRILQNASAYRILMDERCTLLYGNDCFYRLLEYTPESFQEKLEGSCIAYIYPDDRPMVRAEIERALSRPDQYGEWFMRVLTGKGNLLHLHVMGHFTQTEQGCVMEGIDIDVTKQEHIKAELYERNAIFDVLLENSNLSLWTYDIQTHVAKLLSSKRHRRPLSMKGTENYPESVIAMGFIQPSSVPTLRDLLKQVDAGVRTASADIWYAPKDEEVWCDKVTYVNLFDDHGDILRTIGIGQDVTEERVAQQQYNEELQYQQSLQNENLITKVRANLTKGVMESYEGAENARICYAGLPYDVSVEMLANACYTQEDRDRILKMLNRQRIVDGFERGQHSFSFDYRRKMRDGQIIWANISSKTYCDMQSRDIKCFIYTMNINRRKINEEIIQKVASAEHDYIMLVNLNTDEFSLFASHPGGALRLPPQQGTNFAEMCADLNHANVAEADVERAVRDLTPDVMRKNLSLAPLFSTAYLTKTNHDGESYKKIEYFWLDEEQGLLILTRSDISEIAREQRRQQQLLKDALTRAEQASNAKTDFLAKMSHEIRTPMNAIIGMNALAAQNIHDPDAISDCIAKVGISARYLLTLINDILDMSRIESGKVNLYKEEILFEPFVRDVNTVIYTQASERHLLYDSLITGHVADAYVGDGMKLQQILINLLGNAVKFTPPGGKVQLMISQERVEHHIAHMRFTVSDTGVGISEEFQKVMFDPFEQERQGMTAPYGGTGLGLAITKNLVSLMGGSISVNSIVGVGSEFVVSIPLEISDSKADHQPPEGLCLEKMSALVVDDEILICEQTQTLLHDMGMKAEWVTGGAQAVELVKQRQTAQKNYDMVLVDWKLPDLDGIETARQIRQIVGPDVTIIIMTAYEWTEIEKEAREAGVNMLMTKPLFKASLISTFEQIFRPKAPPLAMQKPKDYDFTGKRVLLVEDHLLNVEVAKRLLEAKGMQVEVAENGLAAIEAFAAAPLGHFCAILMDIRMPVMDGLTATKSIRQMKKKTAKTIPIIAMSANAFDEDIEKSRAAGINAHLAKPIDPEILYRTLQELLTAKRT